ncbi:hypothetical protein [Pseudoalteromonas spongiae]|uniref:hypothetical protein n=1 Tax=Pseudoalteromonas spongiae TaxID=298657 RepID=UPI00110A32DF|nr:hypothetical protein [Pseudoalteromonas spongiae]TMO87084.1 hypothetical protein CWC15_04145 [Pseudoalteromonas spongiae]
MKAGDIVLIDTNVILETHRIARWHHLSSNFNVHTVEKVIEETQTGYQKRSTEELIDQKELTESFAKVYAVSEEEIAATMMISPEIFNLDAGERDLLIYAASFEGDCWLISSPDSAAMRAAHKQGWLDKVVSLENLLETINCQPNIALRENYTKKWDEAKKSQIRLGIL